MRTLLACGAALATATLFPLPAGVDTTAAAGTKCHAAYDILADPGLSTTPKRITNWTPRPGRIRCDGAVLGHEVKGAGSIVNISKIGLSQPADCVNGGDGFATLQIRLPGADGRPLALFEAGTFTFGGVKNGLLTGKLTTDHLDATIRALPLAGDCITRPVTRARVTLEMTVHPAAN
jgi:hypothetical protein